MCVVPCESKAQRALKDLVDGHGSIFTSITFSFATVDLSEKFGVPAHKIGSCEMDNCPLLYCAENTQKRYWIYLRNYVVLHT